MNFDRLSADVTREERSDMVKTVNFYGIIT